RKRDLSSHDDRERRAGKLRYDRDHCLEQERRARPSSSAAATWSPLMRGTGLVIAVILSVYSAAAAEIRMEERDGVLYVRDGAPSQVVAPQPSSPPGEPIAPQTVAPYRDLIRAAAQRHAPAPAARRSVIRAAT